MRNTPAWEDDFVEVGKIRHLDFETAEELLAADALRKKYHLNRHDNFMPKTNEPISEFHGRMKKFYNVIKDWDFMFEFERDGIYWHKEVTTKARLEIFEKVGT